MQVSEIVAWQSDNRWFILHSPFTFIAFFIFFISVVAETNRTPFDIPEAESELVAGWMTEFSGFKWSIFFMSEYANMLIVSLVASFVFLGGWLSPFTIINILPDSWLIFDGIYWGIFWLLIKTSPEEGLINPNNIPIVVVFPQPFGPNKPSIDPLLIFKFKFLTAQTLLYFLLKFFISIVIF